MTTDKESRPVSRAVRRACARMLERASQKVPDLLRAWEDRLDVPTPIDRTLRDRFAFGLDQSMTVEDLVYLSYLLNVSPPSLLREAWKEDAWPMLQHDHLGFGDHSNYMDDWLWGYRPLPGQDDEFFTRHQPVRLLVQPGGPTSLGTKFLAIHSELARLEAAARAGNAALQSDSARALVKMLRAIVSETE